MSCLVCLLEEPSAREMLKGVLPRILPAHIHVEYMVFEGKQDMDKRIMRRIRHWMQPDSSFLLLRDQDSSDCHEVKRHLQGKVAESGKAGNTIIRIACHELESFYLGDLGAVEKALGVRGIGRRQNEERFRNPDRLANPKQELRRIARRYQPVGGSRNIGKVLSLDEDNRSKSFHVLLGSLQAVAETFEP